MRAGKLDKRIQIETLEIGRDDLNGGVPVWKPWLEVWASWRPLKESEFFSGDVLNERVDGVFTVRKIPAPDATMRILYRGVAYDIFPPREVQRNQGWELTVKGINRDA